MTLAARLRRSHFLFLGYGLVDWSFRVFLHRLWPDEQPAYRSWAVQAEPGPLERDFWRRRAIELVDLPLDDEVDRLRIRLQAERVPVEVSMSVPATRVPLASPYKGLAPFEDSDAGRAPLLRAGLGD